MHHLWRKRAKNGCKTNFKCVLCALKAKKKRNQRQNDRPLNRHTPSVALRAEVKEKFLYHNIVKYNVK